MKTDLAFIYGFKAMNGKWYVGQTKGLVHRINEHYSDLKNKKHSNPKLQNYVNNYGIDSIKFHLLKIVNYRSRNVEEKRLIKLLKAKTEGFNCTDGGENRAKRYGLKTFKIKNIYTEEEFEGKNVNQFCLTRGLSASGINLAISGKYDVSQGWYNPERFTPIKHELIAPDGEKHEFYDYPEFCKRFWLNADMIGHILKDNLYEHKGWKKPIPVIGPRGKSFKILDSYGKVF